MIVLFSALVWSAMQRSLKCLRKECWYGIALAIALVSLRQLLSIQRRLKTDALQLGLNILS